MIQVCKGLSAKRGRNVWCRAPMLHAKHQVKTAALKKKLGGVCREACSVPGDWIHCAGGGACLTATTLRPKRSQRLLLLPDHHLATPQLSLVVGRHWLHVSHRGRETFGLPSGDCAPSPICESSKWVLNVAVKANKKTVHRYRSRNC
jgi:hypothetical protein